MSTVHLAILGSTNGTDLIAIHDAIVSGHLNARIDIVITNRSAAQILQKAHSWGIPSKFIEPTNTREEFDRIILSELSQYPIDLIVLIGYMRIISPVLLRAYPDKIINVHPSLLPKFAGGMNMDVHAQVMAAGEKETGCTVHIVDEGVDTGRILLQKKCLVNDSDTPQTLKARVQKLEGEALIEVITNF
ncbi:MAG: phosphoribosylglycinamide formyltransferase [Candidatus Magasanikbacteria bacterium]